MKRKRGNAKRITENKEYQEAQEAQEAHWCCEHLRQGERGGVILLNETDVIIIFNFFLLLRFYWIV